MDVTFTKASGRRYIIGIDRQVGPRLAARPGPGYHPYLPHDVVHFVVETEAGIRGGVFGRAAAGDCGIFWPADPAERRRALRRKRRPSPEEDADMARSERLAAICLPLWEMRAGRRHRPPEWLTGYPPGEVETPLLERICARLDEIARHWHALRIGGSLTLTWPYPEGRRRPPAPRRRGHRQTVRRRPARLSAR
ncbi:MAG TPA: hypothetical protein VF069_07105 [Streptosporangiaceae bacterium]